MPQYKLKKAEEFQIDVDEALIDDQHPKDTVRGGPVDKERAKEEGTKKAAPDKQ